MLDENFLLRREQVVLEAAERHVVACGLLEPLEVELEVVGNVLLDVEFVDGEAVGDVHGGLGESGGHFGLLEFVVLFGHGVVGLLDDLCVKAGTNR